MLSIDPLGLDSVMLDEARAYLRVEAAEEDASLSSIMLASIGHAERFTGQILLRREIREILTAGSPWQTLSAFPVTDVTGAIGIPAEGARFALDVSAYEAKIGSRGEAHFRVAQPGSAGRVEVAYQAGFATNWAAVPEIMRLAVLRLAGYLHANRDSAADTGPPAAVTALLLPWRRVRLT